MDKTRVFVSSTCYDLSQVRRDLEAFILGLGHEPVLSDSQALAIPPGLDTVEACKWLVHASDIFILIIGGRYGSADATTGKSVTNLEYETALAAGMPIYAFVDREVWLKRDTYYRLHEMVEDGSLSEEKLKAALGTKIEDPRVFRFLDQIIRAQRDSWLREFSTAEEIVDALKRSWSLLLKELLTKHRVTKRDSTSNSSQPLLKLGWQSPQGDELEMLVIPPAPTVDVPEILKLISRLRPAQKDLDLIAESRDEIDRRLKRQGKEPSLAAYDLFLRSLDEAERVVREDPTAFRWRHNLLARCVTPALVVSNFGACPADEIVIYIKPNNRVLFAEPSEWAKTELFLPTHRPEHIDEVLKAAISTIAPSPPATLLLTNYLSGLEAGHSIYSNSFPNFGREPEFAVEEGSLRVDIPGRLKHNFVRRVSADRPMLLLPRI